MTVASFLKEFWYWILIAILATSITFLGYKLDAKDSEIAQVKLENENSLLTSKTEYQEVVIKAQEQVIEANNKVNGVVSDYHKSIGRQNERTENAHKELQTVIPSIVRESCDFGVDWLLKNNNFISSSSSNTVTRDSE